MITCRQLYMWLEVTLSLVLRNNKDGHSCDIV